jgi:hypothetical protein
MKSRIKPIGARKWKSELNSEAFLSGLDTILEHTEKTEKEAAFKVDYIPEIDTFTYPEKIHLGNKTSVSYDHPIYLTRANELYEAQFGLPFPHEKNGEWDVRLRELVKGGKHKQIMYEQMKGEKWQLENKIDLEIEYPETKDLWERVEREQRLFEETLNREHPPTSYRGINVHTHPLDEYLIPSPNDLKNINSRRLSNEKLFEDDVINTRRSLIPNPLSIIAGKGRRDLAGIKHDMLIIQERSRSPLTSEADFKETSEDFCKFIFKSEENSLKSIFGNAPRIEHNIEQKYNIIPVTYYPHIGKVFSGKRWGLLCERN